MTDSKYFTTTKKGEIFELKSELNHDKKEKKKEAVKKVNIWALTLSSLLLFTDSELTLFMSLRVQKYKSILFLESVMDRLVFWSIL